MMKKRIVLIGMIAAVLAAGCGKDRMAGTAISEEAATTESTENIVEESGTEKKEQEKEKTDTALIFEELEDLEFYFASGAGGWRTVLQIKEDGSFSGEYSDGDMGSTGEGYPNGTYYYCEFEGRFTQPVKVNDYTYSMKIEEINCENEPETKEIIDETLYYYSTPYGLDGAEEVLLYLPDAPTAELPEEYMSWVRNDMVDFDALQLPFYGLYNVTEQNGFSSYDICAGLEEYMESIKEESDRLKAELRQGILTQLEMNMTSKELYDLWDGALNYLWGEVKDTLSEEEFAVLLEEQRVWIAEKEKAVKEEGKESEGGSIYALIVNEKAAELTEERVYELYELLK